MKSIEELLRQINLKNIVSESVLKQCKNDLQTIFNRFQQIKTKGTQQILFWFQANRYRIKALPDFQPTQSTSFLNQLISYLMVGVSICFDGKIPRPHQIISFWLNIHFKKMILQVKTGEGKTMIVALTALYYALRGKKVDIFTSSATLAMTETQPNSSVSKIFKMFGITLSDVCRERSVNPEQAYQNQVIYGTSFEFQADYLFKVFSARLKYFKDRQFDENHVAILDEVDALLIDNMRNSTRIASEKPLFECIKAIFILIHQVKRELIVAKNQFCGQLKVKILEEEIKFDYLVNYNLNSKDERKYIEEEQAEILKIIRGALMTKIKHIIPKYLIEGQDSYITLMLPLWIKSSYQILNYHRDVHFTVDQETRQIIPVDIATGTYQKRTKWMNGVHQFLQLKYGFDPSIDTLMTNYESNLIFFRRYKNYLYGMTGTISESLASSDVQKHSIFEEFLVYTYQVEIYKIPTAKERKLKIKPPKIFPNYQQWMNALIRDSKLFSKTQMVLLIFRTIKQAKEFLEIFSQKQSYRIIQLYDHDQYFNSMKNSFDELRTIIVSTNLGGRGTDIDIKNDKILKNGGLYVMMTYFADNWRIQEQAFGRAGRNGQPGSGAFYINIDNEDLSERMRDIQKNEKSCTQYLSKLCQARKQIQLEAFASSKVAIKNEEIKKQLLNLFYAKYLGSNNKRLAQLQIILQQRQRIIPKCKDELVQYYTLKMQNQIAQQQWGIFLKRKIIEKEKQQKILSVNFRDFQRQFEFNRKITNVNPGFFAICGSQLLQIDKDKSQKLFDQAIQQNQKSWVSRYYKIYFTVQKYSDIKLTQTIAEQIINQLKEICQTIIVQYSLQMAMLANSKLSQASKAERTKQINFYMNIMTTLQSIGLSLQKYVIEEKKVMMMSCGIKRAQNNVSSIQIKGLRHTICNFKMVRIVKEKQEDDGFFQSIWNFAKSVAMTAVSVIATVVATVATPFIAICGGNTTQLWSGVESLWKKTGQSWKRTISRMSPIAVTALSLISIYFLGPLGGSAVAASLISWLFLLPGETIERTEQMPLVQGRQAEVLRLVEITGLCQLTEEAKVKIDKLRSKMQQRKKQVRDQFKILYNYIKQFKANRLSQPNKKKLIQAVFGEKEHHQGLEQATFRVMNKKKTIQRAQKEINKLEKQREMNSDELDAVHKAFSNNLHSQVQKNIDKNVEVLKNNEKAVQADYDELNKKIKKQNENLEKISELVVNNINQNINLDKVQKITPVENIKTKIKLNFVTDAFLGKQLKKIDESQIKMAQNNQQRAQFFQIFDKTAVADNIIVIDQAKILNQTAKQLFKETKLGVSDQMEQILNKKEHSAQQKLQDQLQKDRQIIEIETLTESAKKIQQYKITPANQISQINKPVYYQFILKQKCLMNYIEFITVTSPSDVKPRLEAYNKSGKDALILCEKTAIFMNSEGIIYKCYEPESSQVLNKVATIFEQQKNNIVFAKSRELQEKGIGNYLISDLRRFIDGLPLNKEPNMLTQIQIQKQYIQALMIESNSRTGEKVSRQMRQKQQSPLLMCYFPFQLHIESNELKEYCNKLVDQICKNLYRQAEEYQANRMLVLSAKDELLEEQKKLILVNLPKMREFVQTKIKKVARRR